MKQPTHRVSTRLTAALLAIIVLWLAPASAFGTMSDSHCAMAPTPGGIITSVAADAGTTCQHLQQIGCPAGACGVSAAVQPDRVTPAAAAPVVALETPGVVVLGSGPPSAPPTPPPNS